MNSWQPITGPIERKVLVTNNLDARDAFGQMSHVWVVNIVSQDDEAKGKFCAFDWNTKLWGLTHYAEIPSTE